MEPAVCVRAAMMYAPRDMSPQAKLGITLAQQVGIGVSFFIAFVAFIMGTGLPSFGVLSECGVLQWDAVNHRIVTAAIDLGATGDCAVTGLLPFDQVTPATNDVGCVVTNGTDFFITPCDGSGLVELNNTDLVIGILGVANGGTGNGSLGTGFVKSPGPGLPFTTALTVNMDTEVNGVLSPDNGGLGTDSLDAGYLKSPGVGCDIVSVATIPITDTTGTVPVNRGGTDATTFVAGFVISPGGTTALTTVADVDLANNVTGVLPIVNGGTGHPSFTTGYLLANNSDITSVYPIPSPDIAVTLMDKTLAGVTTILDVGTDALLYIDSGGVLTGVRLEFGEGFNVTTSGSDPTIIHVEVANFTVEGGNVTSVVPISFGGTGQSSLGNGIMQVNLGVVSSTTAPVQFGGTGLTTYTAGDIIYASGTTTLSKLPGGTTGMTLHADGTAPPYWDLVFLDSTSEVTGTLPVGNGGTGIVTYVIGDMLYADSTTTLARLAASTAGYTLHTNGVGTAPTWSQVTLTAAAAQVTGTLPATNGGTGWASFAFGDILYAGSTTSLSRLASSGPSKVLLSSGGAPSWGQVPLASHVTGTLPVGNGGTGIVTYAVGDLLVATGSTTLARFPDVVTGNVLLSGGVTTAPVYGKVSLTAHIDTTTVLPSINGGTGFGTGNPYVIGDILFASATTTLSVLPASTAGLTLHTNGAGTAPTWAKVALGSGLQVSGVLPASFGGTGFGSIANGGTEYGIGDILYASGTSTLSKLLAGTAGQVLHTNGIGFAPTWAAVALASQVSGTLPVANGGTGLTTYPIGSLLIGSGTNTITTLSDVATGQVLLSGGLLTAPAYGQVSLTTHVTGVLPVANGGTGAATFTAGIVKSVGGTSALVTATTVSLNSEVSGTLPQTNGGTGYTAYAAGVILYGDGTSLQKLLAGTSNQVLHGGTTPSWGAVALASQVSGTLGFGNGGTGQISYTNGQLLIGNTGTGGLSKSTLTSGSGIVITNAAGAITIAAASAAKAWYFREVYTGTNEPGPSVNDATVLRAINTETLSSGSEVTISTPSTGTMTLTTGTYDFWASANCYRCDEHMVILYCVTCGGVGGDLAYGTAEYTANAALVTTRSFVRTRYTIAGASENIRLLHYTKTAVSGGFDGGYYSGSYGSNPRTYAHIEIVKIA